MNKRTNIYTNEQLPSGSFGTAMLVHYDARTPLSLTALT